MDRQAIEVHGTVEFSNANRALLKTVDSSDVGDPLWHLSDIMFAPDVVRSQQRSGHYTVVPRISDFEPHVWTGCVFAKGILRDCGSR